MGKKKQILSYFPNLSSPESHNEPQINLLCDGLSCVFSKGLVPCSCLSLVNGFLVSEPGRMGGGFWCSKEMGKYFFFFLKYLFSLFSLSLPFSFFSPSLSYLLPSPLCAEHSKEEGQEGQRQRKGQGQEER